ncbi:hypothetical protein HUS90_36575, partial [Pseudomonas protegens]|nr:hypothetical protein [Pseudomonas protegens]
MYSPTLPSRPNVYEARAAAAGATLVNGAHRQVNLANDQHVTVFQG